MRAGEHFLAGAGLAGQEHRDVGAGDAAGDRQQVGHLLGDPQAAVGLQGIGRPQRGALLLLAAVAVEGDGRLHQLADGDGGAAVGQAGPQPGDDFPALVAMAAADDAEVAVRVGGEAHRVGVGPAVDGDAAGRLVAARHQGERLGRLAVFEQGVGLARQHVRIASQLHEGHRVVQARTGHVLDITGRLDRTPFETTSGRFQYSVCRSHLDRCSPGFRLDKRLVPEPVFGHR